MGLVKNELLEWEMGQSARDWIEENHGLTEEDMDTAEWKEAMDDYDLAMLIKTKQEEYDWYDPEEIKRLALREFNEIHAIFLPQLMSLKHWHGNEDNPMMQKMRISYGVTLMEVFLQDLLMSVAISSEYHMTQSLTHLKGLSALTVPLSSLLTIDIREHIIAEILKCLKEKLFHNVPVVKSLYEAVLNDKAPDEVCQMTGSMIRVVNVRHDIVHRNGKTAEGLEHNITQQEALEAIDDIDKYTRSIYEWTLDKIIS